MLPSKKLATVSALALAGLVAITACSTDSAGSEPGTEASVGEASLSAPPGSDQPGVDTTAAPIPNESVVAPYDLHSACDLLGVVEIEVLLDGLGWGVVVEEPASCVYQDPEATHTVTLTVTDLEQFENFNGITVDFGASGMKADAGSGGYSLVWAPAGADGAVALSQDPAILTEEHMVTLAEMAAIALENAPFA